jgi:hypothetical protein
MAGRFRFHFLVQLGEQLSRYVLRFYLVEFSIC